MELKQDLDYMLDVVMEMGGREKYTGSGISFGCFIDDFGYTKNYGLHVISWSGDKGWLINHLEAEYSHNIAHINFLTSAPVLTSANIIAKLVITNERPPQTEEEVKSLLFKVNEDLFLPEYYGEILEWTNTDRYWAYARLRFTLKEALLQPKTEALRKRCGLE